MKLLANVVVVCLILFSEMVSCLERENEQFEFGRATTPRRAKDEHQLDETEILLRQLIDEQIVALSMSMSMSFVDPYVPPLPSGPPSSFNETDDNRRIDLLTTAPPTQWDSKKNVTCDELLEIVASIDLEVETVPGKESFAQEVASALSQALSREYKACKSPSRRNRRLETGSLFVGSVTVLLDQGSCVVQTEQANRCHLAHVEISASGIDDQQSITTAIENSVESILNDDKSFDDGLKTYGITDVRLRGDETAAPKAAIQAREAETPSGSHVTTAVVAIAATGAFVLGALVVRRSRQSSDYHNLDHEKDISVGESHDYTSPLTISGTAT